MQLKEVGEFGLIDRIQSRLSFSHRDIIKGIGDDAAVTQIGEGKLLLSTSDILIENVHFDANLISAHHLGRKAMAVNISDIAAMGGNPRFFLISLGLPPQLSVEFIDQFINGLLESAESFRTYAIGGDTSLSPERLVINITVLGEILPGYQVYRNGAKVGDQIFVTGNLGDSALGLTILKSKDNRSTVNGIEGHVKALVERHCNPTPRVTEGALIAGNRIASSMIDISDGLISDLEHICIESSVGARIWIQNLPLSQTYQECCREFTDNPVDLALSGGEDYELLFTVEKGKVGTLDKISSEFNTKLTHIGEIVEKDNGITALTDRGERYTVKRKGFDHFS